jgi:hypothetical protein
VEVQTRENKFSRTYNWSYCSHAIVEDGIAEKCFGKYVGPVLFWLQDTYREGREFW